MEAAAAAAKRVAEETAGGDTKRRRTGWDDPVDPEEAKRAVEAIAKRGGGAAAVTPTPAAVSSPLTSAFGGATTPTALGSGDNNAMMNATATIVNIQQQLISLQTNAAMPMAQKEIVQKALLNQLQQARIALSQAKIGSIGMASSLPSATSSNAASAVGRRLYIGNLNYDLGEREVRRLFEPFGAIASIEMSFEPATGKTKGYCFLEYVEPMAAHHAMRMLNGQEVCGRGLKVGWPNSTPGAAALQPPVPFGTPVPGVPDMNEAHRKALEAAREISGGVGGLVVGGAAAAAPSIKNPAARLYVGGIGPEITAQHIQSIFAAFGTIRSCELLPSQDGASPHRGYGFIEFENEESARTAMETMNGFDLAGRKLKVGKANTSGGGAAAAGAVPTPATAAQLAALQSQLSSMGGLSALANLQGGANGSVAPSAPPTAGLDVMEASATPTRVLRLTNMVTPAEVDEELEEEVEDECKGFGKVTSLKIHKNGEGDDPLKVMIYVEFETKEECMEAHKAMDRRLFDGRSIRATYYSEEKYRNGEYKQCTNVWREYANANLRMHSVITCILILV